jgi:hypothetical protein
VNDNLGLHDSALYNGITLTGGIYFADEGVSHVGGYFTPQLTSPRIYTAGSLNKVRCETP